MFKLKVCLYIAFYVVVLLNVMFLNQSIMVHILLMMAIQWKTKLKKGEVKWKDEVQNFDHWPHNVFMSTQYLRFDVYITSVP